MYPWNEQGLSYIASACGKPLYADGLTEKCQCLSYAKVCVEVDTSSVFPVSVEVVFSNGNSAVVSVHYPWKPLQCSGCGIFGHPNDKCPKKEMVVPTKLDEMVVPPVDVGVQQPDLGLVSPGLKAQLGGSSVTSPPSNTVHGSSVGIVQQIVGDLD
ncbi:hypothetical protein Vadar_033313 [Vaccinium darrowii]|uniref:Uncharacterized protein n=1 Tax=Vaccinium darrowii TaxID=229202 RepID=A0ACB7ZGR2_9ERIC|nr:hypothetical protein Vadar_033313 [Vaccinium darrowii]